eukprot:9742676-Heterocapsa_arctica.AAC.1
MAAVRSHFSVMLSRGTSARAYSRASRPKQYTLNNAISLRIVDDIYYYYDNLAYIGAEAVRMPLAHAATPASGTCDSL